MIQYNIALQRLFNRDLVKLKEELNAYSSEAHMWLAAPGISNSAGNLSLHLIGNLNHFIGATLGGSGYVRHRDAEFSTKDVPLASLISELDATIAAVDRVLSGLTNADMDLDFPLELNGRRDPTAQVLIHLYGHLQYHLGQINYHRRLLDK